MVIYRQCSVAKISDADRCRGAGLARREKGAYWQYVTDEQRSQTGWDRQRQCCLFLQLNTRFYGQLLKG